MHLTEEALLCLSATLEFPLPAAHNSQHKWDEQVSSPQLTQLGGLKEKGPLRNQSLYSLQSAQ